MSIFIGKALPKPFGSDPGSGVFSAAIALVVRTIGRRLLCCLRVDLLVAVVNDDEAEERADMAVMLLALVVVLVVLLSRVFVYKRVL